MSESGLIDWEQLEMIFGEEDEEFDEDMAELFHEFVEDGKGCLESLKSASFETDKDSLCRNSHKLKGSSSNFGYSKVAKALANIEDNMAILTYEAFKASLSEAEIAFHESTEEVKRKYAALQN